MTKIRDKYVTFLINKKFVQAAKIIYLIEVGIGIILLFLWKTWIPIILFLINFISLVGIEIRLNENKVSGEKFVFNKKIVSESQIIKLKKLQIVVWLLVFLNAVPFQGILKFLKGPWVNLTSLMVMLQDLLLILIYVGVAIWYSRKIN